MDRKEFLEKSGLAALVGVVLGQSTKMEVVEEGERVEEVRLDEVPQRLFGDVTGWRYEDQVVEFETSGHSLQAGDLVGLGYDALPVKVEQEAVEDILGVVLSVGPGSVKVGMRS
jgi:hypothetical protein